MCEINYRREVRALMVFLSMPQRPEEMLQTQDTQNEQSVKKSPIKDLLATVSAPSKRSGASDSKEC
jgi:hypothetical protein